METDVKPFDGGTTVVAAPGGSSAVGISNANESVDSDLSTWKQLQPAVRQSLLEKELRQTRNALSEKMQEAQILMQRLEQANRVIEQLRQQRRTMLEQDATTAGGGTNCKTTESE